MVIPKIVQARSLFGVGILEVFYSIGGGTGGGGGGEARKLLHVMVVVEIMKEEAWRGMTCVGTWVYERK